MTTKLSILLVEDSENDAELVMNELRRHGFKPDFKRVDTLSAFKTALSQRDWDLIISDYFLGRFDALAVLTSFRKSGLDIPFICVSGMMGDEVAVQVMKGGAHDYIKKERLSRLGPAIERELKAAAVRRKSREVEHYAAHLAAIVEGSDDAITSKDMDGNVLSWNHAAERIYGFTADEMAGQSMSQIVPPERLDEEADILDRVKKGERIERLETLRLRKNGEPVEMSLTISPIFDPTGKVVGASTIGRDVTERKRQEAEKAKLIQDLTDALSHVKMLSGLLPICAWCKKIRDDQGYWQQVETYIMQHAHVDFTHSICPECLKKVSPAKISVRPRRAMRS